MYAKQYELTLPADYDMGIIRKRVATYGHLLDDRPGLGLKAYLIRERGLDGSPVNQYAPFYLWREVGAAAHFLVGGGGFQGIIRDFGRPTVRQWAGVAAFAGPARVGGDALSAAGRRLTALPADRDGSGLHLAEVMEREIEAARVLAQRADVHTVALGVDPTGWQLLRFALWRQEIPADVDDTERYRVLHVSVPELDRLPTDRDW